MIRRIDPVGCACTDCIVGDWSVPIDRAPVAVFDRYVDRFRFNDSRGFVVTDASATSEREFDEWVEAAEAREGR